MPSSLTGPRSGSVANILTGNQIPIYEAKDVKRDETGIPFRYSCWSTAYPSLLLPARLQPKLQPRFQSTCVQRHLG